MTAKKNEVTPMNRKARKAVFKKGEEARISVISNLQVDHMPDRDEADHIQKNQTAKADEEDRIGRHFQVEAGIGKKERSEEHTSELQSLMRISYAVFCLKNKKKINIITKHNEKKK